MGSALASATVPAILVGGGAVATKLAPYIGIALAFAFGPRLLKMGLRLVKGR